MGHPQRQCWADVGPVCSADIVWPWLALVATGMVSEVLPRRSELSDPAIANVEAILLVFSLVDPPFEPPTATRFLITAEQVCQTRGGNSSTCTASVLLLHRCWARQQHCTGTAGPSSCCSPPVHHNIEQHLSSVGF